MIITLTFIYYSKNYHPFCLQYFYWKLNKPNFNYFFSYFFQVRLMEDKDGKRFLFEVYSETNTTVKGCKTDSKGTVVQGKHKSYR